MIFYVLAFFGFVSSNLLLSGLSVAIVAMVNQTAVTDEDVVMSNVTRNPELQYEGGELNWDRNQQGIVLAAFFYGYGFTQVYATNIKARAINKRFVNMKAFMPWPISLSPIHSSKVSRF